MKYLLLTLLLFSCSKNKDCPKVKHKSFHHSELVVILDGYYKGVWAFIEGREELEGNDGCPVEAYKLGSVFLLDEEVIVRPDEIRRVYEKK